MANTFEINGKEYAAPPFTFNTICDLEEKGINLEDFDSKNLSIIRAYFALAIGDVNTAGDEIEKHLIAGGDLTSMVEAISKEMDASGFFKAISATEKAPTPKRKRKAED